MREAIKKEIGEEDILNTVEFATSAGIQRVKLYFMVGLPNEDEEDIESILDTVDKVKQKAPKVSVSVFYKPHAHGSKTSYSLSVDAFWRKILFDATRKHQGIERKNQVSQKRLEKKKS